MQITQQRVMGRKRARRTTQAAPECQFYCYGRGKLSWENCRSGCLRGIHARPTQPGALTAELPGNQSLTKYQHFWQLLEFLFSVSCPSSAREPFRRRSEYSGLPLGCTIYLRSFYWGGGQNENRVQQSSTSF